MLNVVNVKWIYETKKNWLNIFVVMWIWGVQHKVVSFWPPLTVVILIFVWQLTHRKLAGREREAYDMQQRPQRELNWGHCGYIVCNQLIGGFCFWCVWWICVFIFSLTLSLYFPTHHPTWPQNSRELITKWAVWNDILYIYIMTLNILLYEV